MYQSQLKKMLRAVKSLSYISIINKSDVRSDCRKEFLKELLLEYDFTP